MSTKENPKKNPSSSSDNTPNPEIVTRSVCGVIRPIAGNDDYSAAHWSHVGDILGEAIHEAGFDPRLVSDADSVAVIHGTIVQNIFDDPIIVCDVSSRNPNVMFELGMRLAFDKPVVIVKDDETIYSFDTGVIEHVPYPKSLHYQEIRAFKEKLKNKIKSTAEKAKDPNFSPFLKNFRHISPQKIQSVDIPLGDFLVARLDSMDDRINRIVRQTSPPTGPTQARLPRTFVLPAPKSMTEIVQRMAISYDPVSAVSYSNGRIYVSGTFTKDQMVKISNRIGIPLDSQSQSHEIRMFYDSAVTGEIENTSQDDSPATETHPLPE